jgi:hypothetical protein
LSFCPRSLNIIWLDTSPWTSVQYVPHNPKSLLFVQNDLEHGNGTFLWTDGYKYTGGWDTGIKSGYGEYFYNNGDVYRGMVGTFTENLAFYRGRYRELIVAIAVTIGSWDLLFSIR